MTTFTSQVIATDLTPGYRVTIFRNGKNYASRHFPTGPFNPLSVASMNAAVNKAYAKAKAFAQSYGC